MISFGPTTNYSDQRPFRPTIWTLLYCLTHWTHFNIKIVGGGCMLHACCRIKSSHLILRSYWISLYFSFYYFEYLPTRICLFDFTKYRNLLYPPLKYLEIYSMSLSEKKSLQNLILPWVVPICFFLISPWNISGLDAACVLILTHPQPHPLIPE